MGARPPAVLSLLTALTDSCPSWAIWKNIDSALSGAGDVDSLAEPREWPRIIDLFGKWAEAAGLRPIIVCRHLPGALFLVACDQASGRLTELDVYSHLVLRGTAYVVPEEARALTEVDPRGFRRLQPGAEALFLLLAKRPNSRGGQRDETDERIRELLASDPAGVARAATLFGRSAHAAILSADAAATGGRNRLAMARWRFGALARVARTPRLAGSRILFGLRRGSDCPVITALASDRRIPPEPETWLAEVKRSHTVIG